MKQLELYSKKAAVVYIIIKIIKYFNILSYLYIILYFKIIFSFLHNFSNIFKFNYFLFIY